MPTQYTGVPTAAQPPGAAPAFGVYPIVNLPADADPPNASTWAQAYKALADYIAFLMDQKGSGWFGSGGLGDLTVSTVQTWNDPREYNNLTIDATGDVRLNAPLWVKDTLTIQTGGRLHGNGAAGANPAGGTGMDGGNEPLIYLRGGTHGGAGGASGGAPGTAGTSFTGAVVAHSFGNGGVGGNGTTQLGGAGGTNPSSAGSLSGIQFLHVPGMVSAKFTVTGDDLFDTRPAAGGTGGGGGGGEGGASGGGGGAGAGLVWIAARKINFAAVTSVQAIGGAGGNAAGAAGAGGGGGGGRICVFYGINAGLLLTVAAVAGGAGGTGGANPGAAGGAGDLVQRQII